MLAAAIRSALAFADPLQLRRIAIAPIGTEHGAFTAEDAARIIVTTLLADADSTPIEGIVIATPHAPEVRALGEALRAAGAGSRVS